MVRAAQTIEDRIVKEAIENNIEPFFPLKIAWRESRYQAQAVRKDTNGQHDWGVFQLSDHAVKALNVKNPLDPQENIDAAVGLLAHYLKVCGSERAAAYAYARGRCPSKQPPRLAASTRSPEPKKNLSGFFTDPWYGTGSGLSEVWDGSFHIAGVSE
jgi:soluble lytic murein transglycosylase-like protein